MTTNREELFKISSKSICHQCKKIDEKCAMKWKNCQTDAKVGKAYVSSCTDFEDKNKKPN